MRFLTCAGLVFLTFSVACGGDDDGPTRDGGTEDGAVDDRDTGPGRDSGGVDGGPDAQVDPDCGDSILSTGEDCDDGNTEGGDGCSATCEVEDNFACIEVGEPCIRIVTCGNARIEGSETCDDRNTVSGDGCSADCELEDGWVCATVGAACRAARCGDGIVAGFEVCDNGGICNGGDDTACTSDMDCVDADDGDTWTHHDLWMHSTTIAFGGGTFIAKGRNWNGSGFDYGCYVSTDGAASWSACAAELLDAGPVTYAAGQWVAASDGGYLTSSDGVAWSFMASDPAPTELIHTGEGWIGLRNGTAYSSPNLTDWQEMASDVPGFRNWTGGLVLDSNLPVTGLNACEDNG